MSYNEPYQPLSPPEIRHPQERLTQHDFYVSLGIPRPELEVMRMVTEWLALQAPINPVVLMFSYLPETADEPATLEASLVLGAPVDNG